MAFDIATAKPLEQGRTGFDISSAKPVEENAPIKTSKKIGVGEALFSGLKRGAEKTALGITQRIMEYVSDSRKQEIDEFASKMQDGEIPATQENLDKLDAMQEQAITEAKALALSSDYEASQREASKPAQEQQPVASFVGDVVGQMAALPTPVVKAGLAGRSLAGAAEGAGISYLQPTVADEQNNILAGAAVGGLAPVALRGISDVAGAGYRAAIGKPSQEASELIDYAESNNLPLMTSDVIQPTTGYGKNIRSFGETVPVTGTGAARAAQQESRMAQMQKLADEYGEPSDAEIVKSLSRKADKIKSAAGERYTQTIAQMADTEIPLTKTNSEIDKIIKNFSAEGRISNKPLVDLLTGIKNDLSGAPQTLESIRLNRTDFRERIKGEPNIAPDTSARLINSVYSALTQDMTNGVASKLGQEAANKMRQADAIYYREANEIKKTKLKNILAKGDVKPEEATKMLFSRDKSEIETLYGALDKAGRDNARAAIYSKAFDIAQNSPERFLSEINKLKTQNEVFFKGENKKQIDGLIKYLGATREASNAAINTPTGQRLTVLAPAALGGAGGTAAGTTGVLAGLGTYFGVGALASIYESAPVRTILTRMSGVPKGTTEFEKLSRKLEGELSKASTRALQAGEK